MAANRTFSAQMALDTCPEHAHEEIDMYCKTCEKYICSKCVKDEHKDHDWNTLKKISKELRNETVNRMSALVSVSESILAGTTEVLKTLSSQTEDELSRNCSRLESTRGALIDFVNNKINEMKVECEKNHESKMLIVRERKKDLETKSNRVKFLKKSIQAEARHYTDFDVIELHNELRILLCEVQSLSIIPQILNEEIVYQSVLSSTGTELLTRLMGSLEVKQSTDTMTIEREFQLNTEINSICPISQNEAWMHVGKTTITNLWIHLGISCHHWT
ncbi:hypothetical protein FSP39_000689 [Pinctada imbricata]|uniref:B box-type domain-containing protein n=1 Tax=Pinctada imbricata TaxID=66713 RepID=A0AA88YA59_PINIB|nr:hypothetical protein FSP39_000689 [Pinctada imbricata]